MTNLKRWLFIVGVVFLLAFIYVGWTIFQFFDTPLLPAHSQPILIKVLPGASAKRVEALLRQQTQITHPSYWYWYTRLTGQALQSGEYQITPGMKVTSLLHAMIAGKVFIHQITFIEGWTFKQVQQALANAPSLKHRLVGLSNSQIKQALHMDKKLAGQFFPDTYDYVWGDSDVAILQEAHLKMEQVLHRAWQNRAPNLPYHSAYHALIVASLLEKEASVPSERQIIAGIILKRLKIGMPLQIDSSVVYGLGLPYGTALTKKELKKNTPYNTYLHYGLPPTPICLPSLRSIEAALHPKATDFLYYVAKGDGRHAFAKTYKAQRQHIRHYILH